MQGAGEALSRVRAGPASHVLEVPKDYVGCIPSSRSHDASSWNQSSAQRPARKGTGRDSQTAAAIGHTAWALGSFHAQLGESRQAAATLASCPTPCQHPCLNRKPLGRLAGNADV